MENTWKAQNTPIEQSIYGQYITKAKRTYPSRSSDNMPIGKKNKPFLRYRSVLDELLDTPCQIHATPYNVPNHCLRAYWVIRQVAKSGTTILATTISRERDVDVFTVFEMFSSNNRRKRANRELAEVYQTSSASPWSDTTISFSADDAP